MSRYVVGIDLGTTNCALAAVDRQAGEKPAVEPFEIPQLVAPGLVEARATLPSFLLLPGPGELPEGATRLPWGEPGHAVGELARSRGAELPHRLISSAKSWLGNGAVDRTAAILPWGATEGDKLSPIDASSQYLLHLREAWDAAHPDAPLAEQDVYLTVPASFDAVAREMTMNAAHLAGLSQVSLLEEPQAAFYSWLARQGDAWRKQLRVGDVVLVCDVGGGTTDFSLIQVTDSGGDLALERVAVGDHILLGGDNMDLMLAYFLAGQLGEKGVQLDAWQMRGLVQSCRAAKEQLFSARPPESVPIAVLGRGSKVIGGSLKTELRLDDVVNNIVNGFFPVVAAGDKPNKPRRSGLAELGLPYAQDAAVSKHLAEFLGRHGKQPTAVLWNGGVMKGAALRQRLLENLSAWGATPRTLEGTDLDLAVAHGAACYGMTRRGRGVRIRGGTARSYYIGVETAMPAVPGLPPPIKAICVVPFGMEEGTEADVPAAEMGLVVGEPAEFRFLGSTTRKSDAIGTVVEGHAVGTLDELAPVETVLPADATSAEGAIVPVRLHSHVTAVGTLELSAVARDGRRWKLEYEVRERE